MSDFVYKGRTVTDIALRLLDLEIDDETYMTVLGSIGKGIGVSIERIGNADDLGFEHFAEPLIDLETAVIEASLGTAFVACQTKITSVVEAARGVRKAALSDGYRFTAFGDKDYLVRGVHPTFDGTYSKIEILWALANYFKHRDQWLPGAWQMSPSVLIQRTVDAIKTAGLQEGSTGNLRAGAKALGNATYDNVGAFGEIVGTWATTLRQKIRDDIGK